MKTAKNLNRKEVSELKIRLYSNPKGTGWLGWIDDCKSRAIAFIRLDGSVLWNW